MEAMKVKPFYSIVEKNCNEPSDRIKVIIAVALASAFNLKTDDFTGFKAYEFLVPSCTDGRYTGLSSVFGVDLQNGDSYVLSETPLPGLIQATGISSQQSWTRLDWVI